MRAKALAVALIATAADASQVDIPGPPGSGLFGSHVAVLPNGNFVVTDPWYSTTSTRHVGAVYLFDRGGTLISALTGSSEEDNVGSDQILVLRNGNFVVASQQWHNGDVPDAGAVTWINGTRGLSGIVSTANSLVGSSANDSVGDYNGLVELSNGNYVVASPAWSNGSVRNVGAVTWANGNTGIAGAVSEDNSLVGTEAGDLLSAEQSFLPGIVTLPNGNYVVMSAFWHWSSSANAGVVTLGNGAGGTVGPVSAANSLTGTTPCYTDVFGLSHQVVVLANRNFVVPSACWSHDDDTEVGAVTWVDGARGLAGEVSPRNSMIGAAAYDHFGSSGVTPLSNGNYVVSSLSWGGGKGAATWVAGDARSTGRATPGNSLVGSTGGENGDFVGAGVTPLANGNYVVHSPWWNGAVGALTWGDGAKGSNGTVSASNSLTGAAPNDYVGFGSVAALSSGDYAVASPYWSNGRLAQVGAITWARGDAATAAIVGAGNSVVGAQANDQVGRGGVFAIGSGNVLALSPEWANGAATRAGAITWLDGGGPRTGVVSPENSLVGTTKDDALGDYGSASLSNGNFVVASSGWHDASGDAVGAITWIGGEHDLGGVVSAANSLVGTAEHYAGPIVTVLSDGNYVVTNRFSLFGEIESSGSVTLADGRSGLVGPIAPWNSVVADASGYQTWRAAYDATRKRLVVGRPNANVVTLFTPSESIFASDFEP